MHKQDTIWNTLNYGRYFYSAILALGVLCLGAIAMAFGGFGFIFKLTLTISTSMAVLIAILGLAHMRWIVILSVIALLADLVLFMGGAFGH